MFAGVADTHAALWYLFSDARLSSSAKSFMEDAANTRRKVAISAISLALAEVIYLIEKNRLPASAYDELRAALADREHVLEEAPLIIEIVEAMRRVPRADVSDMPDRIVAATGVYFGVPVISRDRRIRAANLETVW